MSDKNNKGLKKVRELIDLMTEHDLVEIEIADGDSKIHLKRPQPVYNTVPAPVPAPAATPAASGSTEPSDTDTPSDKDVIRSPIVGTFYASPSPDAKPYVAVGSMVTAETVVCIIEAMKVMNEIKSQISGTITQVLCKGGQAVEYDQPMFKVKPD